MKILMIEHFSGGNRYTVELCENLAEYAEITLLTVDNSLITGKKAYDYKKVLCGHGGSLPKRIKKYLKSLWSTVKEVIKGKYNCVHVQTFRISFIEILLYLFLKPNIKELVYTAHNILPHEINFVDKLMYKIMYKISNRIVVHNNYCKALLVKNFKINENKIFVIPHGTYQSYKMYEIEGSTAKSKFTILQLGTIREYKGIITLIDAIGLLPEKYKKKVQVIIAGSQALKLDSTDYQRLVNEKGLQKTIIFLNNRVQDEEICSMYNKADVCVLPYKEVYGSGALLMSYTFNKPVIVSDIPTFIEETDMGKTGLLFKNGNSYDLKEKIIEFINLKQENIDEMKENIVRLINEKYNWSISAKLTYEIYCHNYREDILNRSEVIGQNKTIN